MGASVGTGVSVCLGKDAETADTSLIFSVVTSFAFLCLFYVLLPCGDVSTLGKKIVQHH